jgi:hypothetical protein
MSNLNQSLKAIDSAIFITLLAAILVVFVVNFLPSACFAILSYLYGL